MHYKPPDLLRDTPRPSVNLTGLRVCAETHLPVPVAEIIKSSPRISVEAWFVQEAVEWRADIAPLVDGLLGELELRNSHHILLVSRPWEGDRWVYQLIVRLRPAADARAEHTVRVSTSLSALGSAVAQTPVLCCLPDILRRVVTLELDDIVLPQTAACFSGCELAQLHTLTIRFSPPSPSACVLQWNNFRDWVNANAATRPLRCPSLATLTLSWSGPPPETYHGPPPPTVITQALLLDLAALMGGEAKLDLQLRGILLQRSAGQEEGFKLRFEYLDDARASITFLPEM
ncbi:hypothetical protein AURDEDRAFT_128825 [Auricularia subglabra TFB-10046 SS5]|nr:hypothetical protein AURDEDRAFT_128825 [Auricularia subglabra TFB-10046 SS5]